MKIKSSCLASTSLFRRRIVFDIVHFRSATLVTSSRTRRFRPEPSWHTSSCRMVLFGSVEAHSQRAIDRIVARVTRGTSVLGPTLSSEVGQATLMESADMSCSGATLGSGRRRRLLSTAGHVVRSDSTTRSQIERGATSRRRGCGVEAACHHAFSHGSVGGYGLL